MKDLKRKTVSSALLKHELIPVLTGGKVLHKPSMNYSISTLCLSSLSITWE